MIWVLVSIAAGMAAIAVYAYFFPTKVPAWESTLGSLWIIIAPILFDVVSYLMADQTWTEAIPQKYVTLSLVFIGLLNIVLRRMNLDRPKP